MKVVEIVADLISKTPMIKLVFKDVQANLYAKLEYLNPWGSVKDRIAKQMIEQAEKRGVARAGTAKGYKVVIVMPGTTSPERRSIMRHYGADVVLTPHADFVEGALAKAKELAKQSGWWMPSQFENFDNVAAHRENTGRDSEAGSWRMGGCFCCWNWYRW